MPMPIALYDARWRIYARNPGMPPHYVAEGAKAHAARANFPQRILEIITEKIEKWNL